MSSGRCTSVVRPTQYRESTTSNASTYAVTESTATSSPASRRARAKPTAASSVTRHQRCQAGGAYPFLVLVVLHDRSQGGGGRRFVELGSAEGGEGLRPVDGLGH